MTLRALWIAFHVAGRAPRRPGPRPIVLLLLLPALTTLLALSTARSGEKKYWVLFSDKGPLDPGAGQSAPLLKGSAGYEQARAIISPRALVRRSKVLPRESILDAADLPLCGRYIDMVRHAGGLLAQESRWMNAASFRLSAEALERVKLLACVRSVEPVAGFHDKPLPRTESGAPEGGRRSSPGVVLGGAVEYGPSLAQNQIIGVESLHSAGITGKGVLVGMLDSGFRWRLHEALRTRKVIAERDFIQNDDTTANQAGDSPDQDFHGTLTFSLAGGFMPGRLIGPAFDAEFMLAKTEYVPGGSLDYHWEEDNWAAAIEWMEAQGVDVASSSLGYSTFIDGNNYTWDHGDFNGRTSVTARAAARAARLGVVVCNAMGNEGNGDGVTGTLITPADADSILSVGAISFSRLLTSFSSTGPTNDGRIKPDLVAPGAAGVVCAVPPNGYSTGIQGTSLSTPLTAGVAALLLAARPELTPVGLRDLLRANADTVDMARYPAVPNNFTGWGLADAFRAAISLGPIFSDSLAAGVLDSQSVISTTVISKFGLQSVTAAAHYRVGTDSTDLPLALSLDSTMFFPASGRYTVTLPRLPRGTPVRFTIAASDSAGHSYQSPAAALRSVWQVRAGIEGAERIPAVAPPPPPPALPASYALDQNYPNPLDLRVSPVAHFKFEVRSLSAAASPAAAAAAAAGGGGEHVTLKIYDVLGREVSTVVSSEELPPGEYIRSWDARGFASGVYFYRLSAPSFTSTRKLVLLR